MVVYVSRPESDALIASIMRRVGYHGRKVKISDKVPTSLDSYWDGGSRDTYCFYAILTGDVLQVESNHPMFEPDKPRKLRELPEGILLIEHSIFCGKDLGITIYSKHNLNLLLPPAAKVEMTEDEKIVLELCCGRIPSARRETAACYYGIGYERYEAALAGLKTKGLLNKAGAATAEGKTLRATWNRWM